MMILLVSFVTSSLKTGWKSEVDYFLIHGCKGRNFTGKVCNNVKFCNIFCLNSNLREFLELAELNSINLLIL